MSSITEDRRPLGVEPFWTDRRLEQAIWAFVALGVVLRVGRSLMNYPLWWDEAFLAVNFIKRGYVDLLRPLDYGQVCPILFLWAERSIVTLLGFSEWSLRLVPLFCAAASVLLFRSFAGRVVRGIPWLLAVAVFAVSFHPIRHAADVKPYASDLLAALVLLTLAVNWRRAPERTRWMWALASVAPVTIALSHPAVFVAGGVGLGLAPTVWKTRRFQVWMAYLAFGQGALGSFAALYLFFTRAQSAATLGPMQAQWGAAFPPRGSLLALGKWLATVHTGGMFAYPCGGERGASGLTLLLFLIGAGALWRRGRRTVVLLCLAPFALALLAAALRRYPYGGVAHGSPARVMQYLAPGICLLVGFGASVVLEWVSDLRRRRRLLRWGLAALAFIGIVPLVVDAVHPFRAVHSRQARAFAREFWPKFDRDAEPVCLRWDLGLGAWDSANLNVAVYLCNQQIYAPSRRRTVPPRAVSSRHPLRCVLSLMDPSDRRVVAWLEEMKADFDMKERRTLDVNMSGPGAAARFERYVVYEFAPKDGPPN